jgi:nitrite reductase/ring-hydroxylating ferredoxin subunit
LKLVGRVPRSLLLATDFVRLPYPPWNVLVSLVDGEPCAIEDACNHAGASLSEGPREEDRVVCPMHAYVFSLRTGKLIAPAGLCDDQRAFLATTEGDEVVVWDPFALEIVQPTP